MVEPEIIAHLKKFGFKEYEAKVYLGLVGLGTATARELHEITGVPDGRIYSVLKDLALKGYVLVQAGSPTYYQAEDPMTVIKSLKKEYDTAIDETGAYLKELKTRTQPPQPVWCLYNSRAIEKRLQAMLRNAENEVLIFCNAPNLLLRILPDLKKAGKHCKTQIFVDKREKFTGMNLHLEEYSEKMTRISENLETMVDNPNNKKIGNYITVIIDGKELIDLEYSGGEPFAIMIKMPQICYMVQTFIQVVNSL